MRVFEGWAGSINEGRSERSRESGDFEPEEVRERIGEDSDSAMFAAETTGGSVLWKSKIQRRVSRKNGCVGCRRERQEGRRQLIYAYTVRIGDVWGRWLRDGGTSAAEPTGAIGRPKRRVKRRPTTASRRPAQALVEVTPSPACV